MIIYFAITLQFGQFGGITWAPSLLPIMFGGLHQDDMKS